MNLKRQTTPDNSRGTGISIYIPRPHEPDSSLCRLIVESASQSPSNPFAPQDLRSPSSDRQRGPTVMKITDSGVRKASLAFRTIRPLTAQLPGWS